MPEASIQKIDGRAARSGSEQTLKKGDGVEARCKGSKKFYPGRIFKDNRDGTYDVKFSGATSHATMLMSSWMAQSM